MELTRSRCYPLYGGTEVRRRRRRRRRRRFRFRHLGRNGVLRLSIRQGPRSGTGMLKREDKREPKAVRVPLRRLFEQDDGGNERKGTDNGVI